MKRVGEIPRLNICIRGGDSLAIYNLRFWESGVTVWHGIDCPQEYLDDSIGGEVKVSRIAQSTVHHIAYSVNCRNPFI